MALQLTPTGDGTFTLHSDEYGQAMHTLSGAYEEALLKHVLPSRVLDRTESVLRVLDIGFGIGYNILALLDKFLREPGGRRVEIMSLEKDPPTMELLDDIHFSGRTGVLYESIKALPGKGKIAGDGYLLRIMIGDARRSVRALGHSTFHAIFHDPYSPPKNPELWTVEFFRELYRVAADGCVLTTYSSVPGVRRAFLEAGFTVGRGPAVGPKREGTVASKGPLKMSLDEGEIGALARGRKSIPYRDPDLSSTKEEIIARREREKGRSD